MSDPIKTNVKAALAAAIATAPVVGAPAQAGSAGAAPLKRGRGRPRKDEAETAAVHPGATPDAFGNGAPTGDPGPPWQDAANIDPAVVAACAAFDMSDVENAKRLHAHFGRDMLVQRSREGVSQDWIVWSGVFWDRDRGTDEARNVAASITDRIKLEVEHIDFTAAEAHALKKAPELRGRDKDALGEDDRTLLDIAAKAPAARDARRGARHRFAVSSGNKGRILAMLEVAAPKATRDPDDFNFDPLAFATKHHTLRFVRKVEVVREPDPECPDPDVERMVERRAVTVRIEATPGHKREDMITKLVPVAYDPEARCPRWDAFLAEFLPPEALRRCVQMYSGLGLTGIALQKVMFHFGNGANGKSVFLETLMRLVGPLGVNLPAASLVGEGRASGHQATPDIARLIGSRIVRVAELPAGLPLKEELVKVLTGGESMPVRNLFKGFIEFTPRFKAHLSGNGLPRIDGTDEGIWRRMCVAHWSVTVPEGRRREFDEVVSEFVREEGPGILNWLIAGVIDFLHHGFIEPAEVKEATKDYRDEMDPIGQFASDCVKAEPGQQVQGRIMYNAYVRWSHANAKRPLSETRFGRTLKQRFKSIKSGVITYVDVVLHSVPDGPSDEHAGYADP